RYDGCALHDRAVAGQPAPAPEASTSIEPESSQATRGNQVMAKLAVGGGRLYAAYQQCDTLLASLTCDSPGDRQSVWVAISSDRGSTVVVAWNGSPPARAGVPQRWYMTVARSDDGGRHFRYRRLDPLLATTDHGTSLADTLYDDFGTAIDRSGAIALAYTQSCAG